MRRSGDKMAISARGAPTICRPKLQLGSAFDISTDSLYHDFPSDPQEGFGRLEGYLRHY